MSGPAPFGMRWTDGALVPELSERDSLRELVEAFVASGGRIKATASALNAKGLTTRRGTPWSDTAVGRVVRNPALDQLIPEALWDRCRPLLEDRSDNGGQRRGRQPVHPLGGVVHCRCGGRMRPRGHGSTGKYICGRCRAKIPEDTLEKLFNESLRAVALDAAEIVAALGTNPRAAEITRMLGGRAVPLSEIWPELDAPRRRRLVDQLVAQLVVGNDDVSVVFSETDDSTVESAPPPLNSLPSQHGSEETGNGATNPGGPLPSPPAGSREDLPLLLPVEQAAEVLHTTPKAVYAMVERGLLPGVVRVGRRVLIRRDELLDSIGGSRAPSPKEVRR